MLFDILKNPIFLGVLAGVITYLYLLWSNSDNKNKKKKEVSLFTPIIVTVIVAIVSYAYFNYNSSEPSPININDDIISVNNPSKYKFSKDASSESQSSIHLISRGVNIPNNLPDVFIETYN